jgi:hypothetical protein
VQEAIVAIETEVEMCDETRHFLEFCKNSPRGLIGTESARELEREAAKEAPELVQASV